MFATSPQEALKMYEEATNTHEFENVRKLIREDAIYYFSNETVQGHKHLKEGKGRGTNVFEKDGEGWKVVHEHLSS